MAVLDRMESALAEGPLFVPPKRTAANPYPIEHDVPMPTTPTRRRRVDGGIKAVVMKVLVPVFTTGMSAQDILVAMKVLCGVDIPRTSLSPQLSRLRQEGMVNLEDGIWRATEKGRNEYPPSV